jgi:16S rRNA (cytidine1402-2'-O)-methyltransferase
MCDILGGERKISLCREITKLNEEVLRLTLAEAVEYYEINEPRGEFVLVVEGASEDGADGEKSPLLSLTPEEHIEHYINEGLSKKDAIKAVAKDRGVPKSKIYKYTI